jgi:class 3 adenylate cyclase
MKGYKVKMGFGLHIGWGIEGAIGSEFKIDASYLSPNVNLASRLEAATKQYGVPILVSHLLHNACSSALKEYMR